ncbi:hypothetical protein ACM7PK_02650 [Pseudomonas aeruginosa]
MTESKICTCPSGDGSLRWPCPKHPAVEHERAEFEAWVRRDWPGAPLRFIRDALPVDDPRYGQYCDDALQRAWVGWQARAALAQPSPVRSSLLINGYQLRDALEFIAPDGTAKQLESEARIEWRQQDADFLEAGLYAWCAEYPEEGCVLLDEEPATAQPSPAQAEKAEAERPEVVAWRYGFSGGIVSDKACLDEWKSGGEYQSLMTVAQHERIVKAWIERWKAYIELSAKIAAQRDAALARVAELEAKLSDPTAVHQWQFSNAWFDGSEEVVLKAGKEGSPIRTLYAAPVAQAQHSVPEGFREKFKQCMELAFAEIAYYVSPEKARDPNSRARKAGALATELLAMLAAAPGKEGL